MLISNNCTNDELHFGLPGGSGVYEYDGDESNVHNDIHLASRRRQPATELWGFHLGTNDVEGYEGDDGDDVDVDEEGHASQSDDVLTQNLVV
jgi:hypothetical protein